MYNARQSQDSGRWQWIPIRGHADWHITLHTQTLPLVIFHCNLCRAWPFSGHPSMPLPFLWHVIMCHNYTIGTWLAFGLSNQNSSNPSSTQSQHQDHSSKWCIALGLLHHHLGQPGPVIPSLQWLTIRCGMMSHPYEKNVSVVAYLPYV